LAGFCPLFASGIAFSGIAQSVSFAGVTHQVVFDDITFGTSLSGVALAAWRRRKQQQPS